MICHAGRSATLPVLSLTVTMIKPRFRTLLITAVGASLLLESCLSAASQAAITISPVAATAEKEHRTAFAAETNPQIENHFAVSRHAPWSAAPDNGNDSVAP